MYPFPPLDEIRELIQIAKREDVGPSDDDVTSRLLIDENAVGVGTILQKAVGISCGLPIVEMICRAYDERLRVEQIPGFHLEIIEGRYSDQRDISHGLLPIPVAAAATAGYLAAFAVVSFMLETAPQVSALVLRDLVIVTLLNVAIALPFFGLVRRVMRPVLANELLDRRRRRREVQPSGPIGLRGLEVKR